MNKSNWNNRFLVAVIAVIVIFAGAMGWIIIRENANTTASATANTPEPVKHASARPVKPYSDNSPSRASESTRQMYDHIQSAEGSGRDAIMAADHSTESYNQGYEWASQHKILSKDDCRQISAEYKQGCQAYLEVKNYISQTDPNMNTPAN